MAGIALRWGVEGCLTGRVVVVEDNQPTLAAMCASVGGAKHRTSPGLAITHGDRLGGGRSKLDWPCTTACCRRQERSRCG
jgi:hypothetical protein